MKKQELKINGGGRAALLATALTVSQFTPVALSAVKTWDGGATTSGTNGTGVNLGTAANWSGDTIPVGGDTLEFTGFDSATTDLAMNVAFVAAPGFAAMNVNQANPLTFATGTNYIRLGAGGTFTVTNGAVSFNAGRLLLGAGTLSTEAFTLTNNSVSPVTWGTGALTGLLGGTGIRNVTFGGSGDWTFNNAIAIAANQTLNLTKDGAGTLSVSGITGAGLGTITVNGGAFKVASGQLAGGNHTGAITNAGTITFSGANQTLAGGITGTGALVKDTDTVSVLTVGGTSNYSGATSLNAGTLIFSGNAVTGAVTAADETTLGVKMTNSSTSPLKPTSLTLGSSTFTTLAVDFNSVANPTVPVIDLGSNTVTANGSSVDVTLTGVGALTSSTNTIKLLSFGSKGGTGSFNLVTTSSGHSTFSLNPTSTALYLNINAATNTWTGSADNNWDIGTLNWSLGDGYLDGDAVLFNDTATVTAVNLAYTLFPGSVTFSNTGAKTYTLTSNSAGGIGGTGPVTLNGTNGTVILATANTYTGTTTIGASNTLQIGDGTTDGSIATSANIANNGTLIYNRVGDAIYNGIISGTGSVVKNGVGTQRLGGLNTYSGGTTVNAGDLQFDVSEGLGSGALILNGGAVTARTGNRTLSNAVTVGGDVTLNTTLGGGNLLTLAGNVDLGGVTRIITVSNTGGAAISGVVSNGALTKAGTGTLTLTGANTYTGLTTVNEGTLQIGNGAVDGSLATPSIVTNGTLAYNLAAPQTATIPISGTGGLTKLGVGTLTLPNANTYSGPTTVTNGILNVQNGGALGTGQVNVVNRNGGVQLQGGITLTNNFLTSNDGTGTGPSTYAVANISGNNTISGTLTLTQGGGETIIRSDSGSLTLSGPVTNDVAVGRTLILTGVSGGTVSGAISDGTGSTGVTKRDAGTWTLSGANTYTGATTVEGGTLTLTSAYLADTSSVVIAPTGAGVLNLTHSDIDQVASLTINGTVLPNGVYDANSPQASGFITGTGKIRVGAAGGYSTWTAGYPFTVGVNDGREQDADQDGLKNELEYVFGSIPVGPGASDLSVLPVIGGDASNITLTFRRSDISESDTAVKVQISTTLGAWTDFVTVGPGDSSGVDVTEDSPTPELDTVIVTIPRSNAVAGKLFTRVSSNPLP
jgi:fibronectin-binding autotransporter adhesin